MKRGHRGDFATPMDHPGRLALLARALPAIGFSRSAHSRWSREVGQASRQGLVGIVWRIFSAYLYLERRREPSRQLARPMEFSRTSISRPVRRGRSKPQKNALDSRKTSDVQSRIPGKGKGLMLYTAILYCRGASSPHHIPSGSVINLENARHSCRPTATRM